MTTKTPPFDKMFTPDEASEVLRVERRSLLKLLREGQLRGVKVGKEWRIPESSLRIFIEQGGSGSTPRSHGGGKDKSQREE